MNKFLLIIGMLVSIGLNAQAIQSTEIAPVFISKDSLQLNGIITTLDQLDSITKKIVIFKRQQAFENEYNTGISNLADKKYATAIDAFKRAYKLNPQFYKLLYSKASAFYELKDYTNAVLDLDSFLLHEESNEQVALLYANLKYVLNNKTEAQAAYKKVLNFNANNAKANYYLGVFAFENGDYNESLNYFNNATISDPKFMVAFHDKASTKRKLGDLVGAVADYSKAIELDATFVSAFINRATVFFNLKQYDKSIDDYTQASSLEPDNYLIYNGRGSAKFDNGDYIGAIKDFDKTILIKSNYSFAYNNRAAAKYKLKDYKGAVDDCNLAIQLDKAYGYAFLNRGIAKQMIRDQSGACEDWRQARELGIKSAEIYINQDCE